MRLAVRARYELARRPWIRWLFVIGLAAGAAHLVRREISHLEQAQREWGDSLTVLVAEVPHEPGDTIRAAATELPVAALPDDALAELPDGARTKRHLVAGEILVAQDVTGSSGPAATADDGDAVVLVPHRTPITLEAGLRVRIVGDGVVLAETGTIVSSVGEIAFVAVPEESAPIVAEAVRNDVATLVFLP
jgi:hypothetical protein